MIIIDEVIYYGKCERLLFKLRLYLKVEFLENKGTIKFSPFIYCLMPGVNRSVTELKYLLNKVHVQCVTSIFVIIQIILIYAWMYKILQST